MKLQYIFNMEEYFLLLYGFGELFKLVSSNELFLYMDIACFLFFFLESLFTEGGAGELNEALLYKLFFALK